MSGVTASANTDEKYAFDLSRLDGECRDILRAVVEHDGEATTSEIKDEAAVERNAASYRYNKLEDCGLVETYVAHPEGGGQKVTHVALTDAGEDAIERGLLEDITDANTNLRQLRRDLTELSELVDEKADRHRMINRLESVEVALRGQFKDEVSELQDEIAAIEASIEEQNVEDLREDVEDLADRVDELDAGVDDRVNALADDVERLDGEIEERLSEISNRVVTLRESLVDLDTAVEDLEATTTELASELNDHREGLEGDLQSVKHDVYSLRRTIDNLHDRIDENGRDHSKLNQRVDTLENRVAAHRETEQEHFEDLDARVRNLTTRLEYLEEHGTEPRPGTNTDDSGGSEEHSSSPASLEDRIRWSVKRVVPMLFPPWGDREAVKEKLLSRGERRFRQHYRRTDKELPPTEQRDQADYLSHLKDDRLRWLAHHGLVDPVVIEAARERKEQRRTL